jgi:hypothetical protein
LFVEPNALSKSNDTHAFRQVFGTQKVVVEGLTEEGEESESPISMASEVDTKYNIPTALSAKPPTHYDHD